MQAYKIKQFLIKCINNYKIKKSAKSLKLFKNKYKGKRCFIIGNGPSLKKEDLEKLKDEITRLQSEWEGFKGKYKELEDNYKKAVDEIFELKDLLNTKQTIIENLQQEYNFLESEVERLLEENKKMSKDLAFVAVEAIRLMGAMRYGKKD